MYAGKVQKALENLVDNPQHSDHFKALKMMRDDSGISRAVERVLNVKVEVTDAEKLETIKLFAKSHNIDPKKLLGFDPHAEPENKPVDAEFEEATADEEELRELGIID